VIYTPTRRALGPVLKLLFFSRVTIVLLLILTYVAAAVYAFDVTGLWRWWMLKDTLFWFFGGAMPSLIKLNKPNREEHFFRDKAIDAIKLTVVLDFILNLYVFNLIVELLLTPLLVTLFGVSIVAGNEDKFEPAKKLVDRVIALIGLSAIMYAVVKLA